MIQPVALQADEHGGGENRGVGTEHIARRFRRAQAILHQQDCAGAAGRAGNRKGAQRIGDVIGLRGHDQDVTIEAGLRRVIGVLNGDASWFQAMLAEHAGHCQRLGTQGLDRRRANHQGHPRAREGKTRGET